MRKLIHKILRFLSVIVIVSTFLAYVCPEVNPATFPYIVHFGTAFSYFFVLNILLAAFWFWRQKKMGWYHIIILLLGYQYVFTFVGTNINNVPIGKKAFKIATHNIGGFLISKDKRYRTQRDSLIKSYATYFDNIGMPDILCLQETGKKDKKVLENLLGYEHSYRLKGTAIFSKIPIESGSALTFKKTFNSAIWVDVKVGQQTIRVYNIHLQSNRVTENAEDVIEGKLDDKKTWNKFATVLKQVGRSTSMRAHQAERIRAHMDDCPYPIVLCGDFNDTQNSYVYKILSEPLCDAFEQKGLGLGSSLSRLIPLLKIDFILYDERLPLDACEILDNDQSDHYPILTSFSL